MPMLKDIKGVVFDLDGTLVDSMWAWKRVDAKYVQRYNLQEPEGFYDKIEGMSFMETAHYYHRTFPQLNSTPEEIGQEWLGMVEKLYQTEIPLKHGAREFLKLLAGRGVRMGIATSNSRGLAESVLEAQQVSGYFDVICTADEVKAGKPAPDVYLKAASTLHIAPEHCLAFEDVPNGILAGKRAGMRVCAIDDPFSADMWEVKKRLADYHINDYRDLLKKTAGRKESFE